jgi:hypothetical protein
MWKQRVQNTLVVPFLLFCSSEGRINSTEVKKKLDFILLIFSGTAATGGGPPR